MKRRVLTWGVLLAISAFLIVGIQGSLAQNGGNTSRYRTVEVRTVQYVWELVSGKDGRVICQAVVDHPTQPSNDETIQLCADQIFPPVQPVTPANTPVPGQPTPVPTPRPTQPSFNLAEFFNSVYWRFITTTELVRTLQQPLPEMILNLTVPPDEEAPYTAIIAAYEPVYGERIESIMGYLNGQPFTCQAARCEVSIPGDSNLEFWATSTLGDESHHVLAGLMVQRVDDANRLQIVGQSPVYLFQDSCALAWGLPLTNLPAWADFPTSPDELSTLKPYQMLSARLLASGVVDGSECGGNKGLTTTNGATTCGLEKSAQATIDWQNSFDVSIWESARSVGVPPRLVKTLIGQESQFWPGNSINAYYEYGLGQINQSGADVALRWDNELFYNICSGLVLDCGKIYGRQPYWMQATMRGGLVRAVDSECPTCANGIDLYRAHDSIDMITRTLRSNCYQANYLAKRSGAVPSYEDMWRFTLVSYHSGYQCLAEALNATRQHQLPIAWDYVQGYLSCPGSIFYVENFWKALESFDSFRYTPTVTDQALAQFIVTPTPAPTVLPTATPNLAMSHVRVLVYVDANKNNYPDPGERVNGVKVSAVSIIGPEISAVTENGEAVLDLSGRPVNQELTVSLPELFRSQKVRAPKDGEVPVVFKLDEPVVPPALP